MPQGAKVAKRRAYHLVSFVSHCLRRDGGHGAFRAFCPPYDTGLETTVRIAKSMRSSVPHLTEWRSLQCWERLLARIVDLQFSAILIVLIFFVLIWLDDFSDDLLARSESRLGLMLIGLIVVAFSIPLNAVLTSRLGSTVGKSIFGIRVRNKNGDKLDIRTAFEREFYVWTIGQAVGIPLLSLLSAAFAERRLKRTGMTWWDERLTIHVDHPRMIRTRLIVLTCIIAAGLSLITLMVIFPDPG